MQVGKNGYRYVWILSGTSEGPLLAEAFIKKGWKVSVSVVTSEAALAYSSLLIEDIWIGAISGISEIRNIIINASMTSRRFDFVLDATHPFANVISSYLQKACKAMDVPLLILDRSIDTSPKANLISSFQDLEDEKLRHKNVLLAIGSRYLKDAVTSLNQVHANLFVRILPNSESLKKALACSISESNIAMFRPVPVKPFGGLESALCRRWSIQAVICRQSGGLTEQLWNRVSNKEDIDLWLLSRPSSSLEFGIQHTLESLLNI